MLRLRPVVRAWVSVESFLLANYPKVKIMGRKAIVIGSAAFVVLNVVYGQTEVTRSVISSCGATAISAHHSLRATVGQPSVEEATSFTHSIVPGFWAGAPSGYRVDDFSAFVACLAGPGTALPSACGGADLNRNGTVDLADFAKMQREFDGM